MLKSRKFLLSNLAGAAGAAVLAAGWALGGAVTPASAGTVILEGSDAIGFHCPIGNAAACDYMNQTWSAIGGASPLPIAVVGTNVTGTPTTSSTHAIMDFADLSTAGNLSQYSAIYFLAGSGCCSSDPGDMAGREADVATYIKHGNTVEIENYDGNSGWDFLTGGGGNSAFVAGIGGSLGGPGCTDAEMVTGLGLANGFTQPAPMGCWTHQAYSEPYFNGLGFNKNFFDSDPAFAADNPGFGPFSSLLSNGSTLSGGIPEPATWAMMLVGFGGLGAAMRSTRQRRALGA